MWTTSQAKAKLSEIIKLARETPQFITNHGNVEVAVVDAAQYEELLQNYKEALFISKKLQAIEAIAIIRDALEKDNGDNPIFENTPSRPLPSFE